MESELDPGKWFCRSFEKLGVGIVGPNVSKPLAAMILSCSPPQTQPSPRWRSQQQPAQCREAVAWAAASVGMQRCVWKVLSGTENHCYPYCRRRPCAKTCREKMGSAETEL